MLLAAVDTHSLEKGGCRWRRKKKRTPPNIRVHMRLKWTPEQRGNGNVVHRIVARNDTQLILISVGIAIFVIHSVSACIRILQLDQQDSAGLCVRADEWICKPVWKKSDDGSGKFRSMIR